MTTIRRLSDSDVRAIFESVHTNHQPPPHLQFQIVPIGPDGLKLSPPSHEFPDGLYVLLKPQKKRKSGHSLELPPTVPSALLHMIMDDELPSTCPWSLSGPQFPHPTAIQQRYCYPKGDPDYSSQKGGALWTMYGTDGKEDLEYRLLHVYFSAKRAIKKDQGSPMSAKRTVAKRTHVHQAKHVRTTAGTRGKGVPTMSTISPTQPSYGIEVTPDVFSRSFHPTNNMVAEDGPSFRPRQLMMPVSKDPFFDPFSMEIDLDAVTASPPRQFMMPEQIFFDPFGEQLDPLFPELDQYSSDPFDEEHCHIAAFETKLREMHSCLKDSIIYSAPEAKQGHLVSILSNWAKQIAQSPLGSLHHLEGV